MITVFDRDGVAQNRRRAVHAPGTHAFLIDWTLRDIGERLSCIQRDFPTCLQIGARGKNIANGIRGIKHHVVTDIIPTDAADIVCDEEFLPFAPSCADLVISALNLHTVNDLPGCLLQIRKALKPDGLFLAGMLGGETLYELRIALSEAELEITGGISPRVAPFADKPQAAGLLQRAGFALPVVDSEIVTVTYENIFALMHDLRFMGEGNAIAERKKTFSRRDIFLRAAEIYAQKFSDTDGRIRATFEIIFLLGWAPHESQQKPLPPGSAKTRLADALETVEIAAGEKPNA